jgi:hypothetical protein
MERKYSLAIHDLRVTDNEKAVETLSSLITRFRVPLTVHLVFDAPLGEYHELLKFISEKINSKSLEVVFHGLTHQCSRKVGKISSFYHKYQAEYLENDEQLRVNTLQMFRNVTELLGRNLGICPPCWLTTKENYKMFKSLSPLYIELLTSLHFQDQKVFSPIVSLGSPKESELFFLRKLARFILFSGMIVRKNKVRVAIHTCDIENTDSMKFFDLIIARLNYKKFQPVLLRELQ